MADVLDDASNFDRPRACVVVVDEEVLVQRTCAMTVACRAEALPHSEHTFCERGADDGDRRRIRSINFREQPSLQQLGADGREVSGRHDAEVRAHAVALIRRSTRDRDLAL